jgi:hypothetical protein
VNIKRFMSKKVVAIGLAAGITLGLGGAAFAYFTAAGSGTAVASVGDTGTWGIVQDGQAANGLMYPGQGSSAVTYTITNMGSGNQALESGDLIATMAATVPGNPDVESQGSAVSGCLAAWFTPVVGTPDVAYGTSIAPNAVEHVTVTVTMSDPAGVNQDGCEGVSPVVSLAASA